MFLRASLDALLRAISGNLSTLCNGLSSSICCFTGRGLVRECIDLRGGIWGLDNCPALEEEPCLLGQGAGQTDFAEC